MVLIRKTVLFFLSQKFCEFIREFFGLSALLIKKIPLKDQKKYANVGEKRSLPVQKRR